MALSFVGGTTAIRTGLIEVLSQRASRSNQPYGIADETVDHLIISCSYLVQKEYKGRHNAIASLIHWTLLKKAGYGVQRPWWRHTPTTVLGKC